MFDYDPSLTESNAYDDRDSETPDFEIIEELAYGLGMDEQDPAEDDPEREYIIGSGINQ